MTNLPLSRESEIVVQKLENETLIYDLKTDKAYCLNKTSSIIYQLCDGTRTVPEISRVLRLSAKSDISEDLVRLALDQFKQDNLLENSDEVEINFGGLSRRQVIRKIGFASLVALPFISSIIAPTSAMAQSGLRALTAPCSAPNQCATGNCVPIPFVPSSICCEPGVTEGRTFQTYIAPTGMCASQGPTRCCDGSGRQIGIVGNNPAFGEDICSCN